MHSVALLIAFLAASTTRPEAKPVWIVVGPKDLVAAAAPLVALRQEQEMRTVVSSAGVEAAIAAAPARPDFLLLIGDETEAPGSEPWRLTSKRRRLYRWRTEQRETYLADLLWGDVDGDGAPDFPVGRIPARTPREVETVVRKIVAYERGLPQINDLRLLGWAGSAQYGPPIDQMAGNLGVTMVERCAPRWSEPWLLVGTRGHPFCGWPVDQPAAFTGQWQRGAALAVLMGHGNEMLFSSIEEDGLNVVYQASDARALEIGQEPCAPLVVLACSAGNFAYRTRCMAESFLLMPGGPVATIGATTESHPLANYYTAVGLIAQMGGTERRLGPLWLNAQRQAAKAHDPAMEFLLKNVEGKLEPNINIANVKRDQVLMYAILGDPATRLRLPEALEARVRPTAAGWEWEADHPAGARTLAAGLRVPAPPTPASQAAATREAANRLLAAANARYAFKPVPFTDDGRTWRGTVTEPGLLRLVAMGPGILRVATLSQRLRASIARANKAAVFAPADGVRADYTLRLELEEFSQVFDTADKSRAVVRLRASLIRNRGIVVQQSFGIERASATPNAEGGVQALIAASDEAGNSLIDWLAANMKK